MAKASAWLALVFAALKSLSLFGIVTSSQTTVAFFILPVFTISLLVAGAVVVLRRIKPGLRLLCAGWGFAIATPAMGLQSLMLTGPIRASMSPPPMMIVMAILPLAACFIGLLLALLARRPHHKS